MPRSDLSQADAAKRGYVAQPDGVQFIQNDSVCSTGGYWLTGALKALAEAVKAICDLEVSDEANVAMFILTAEHPTIRPIDTSCRTMSYGLERITVDAVPWATPAAVAEEFAAARDQTHYRRLKHRSLSKKMFALVSFVCLRKGIWTYREIMDQWNQTCPHADWHYSAVTNFARDFNQARYRLSYGRPTRDRDLEKLFPGRIREYSDPSRPSPKST